jgi:hypothetical protein
LETNTDVRDEVSAIIDALDDQRIALRVSGTSYRIHLRLPEGARVTTPVGKRISGTIEADALRIHPSRGGGQFIEPVVGEPRIIAGRVMAVDEARRRLLVQAAVPMWLTAKPGQDFGVLKVGGMVNCYVQSGARFVPSV